MMASTLSLKALWLLPTLFVLMTLAISAKAETVVLQQGRDGYTGCRTQTLAPEGKPAQGVLPLRGSKHRFVLDFTLPDSLPDKPLARARLAVFLPDAKNPNKFTELFCHAVTTAGPELQADRTTNYNNGRRPGAVDSVELFGPPGPGWFEYPEIQQDIPEGGQWIEFNITPLVENWLNKPASNRGVLVEPTDSPDKRFPSTWEIDIPSEASADADHRPKLILEYPPIDDVKVGMTNPMDRICDLSTRYTYRGDYGRTHAIQLARNETEGFQVVLYPMTGDLRNVRFTASDLTGPDDASLPADRIAFYREDSYKLRKNWKTRDRFFAGKIYEVVDPLIPYQPTDFPRHRHTAVYVTVTTPEDLPAGEYRGTITMTADNLPEPVEVDLTTTVWDYTIPHLWNFHTMGQFIRGNCAKFHGNKWDNALLRAYYDFLLKHRFSPTEQYRQTLSPTHFMDHCLDAGMNTIYLYSVHGKRDKPGKALMDKIQPDYESIRDRKLLDHSLVYIGDETAEWDTMRSYADHVHAYLPGAKVMIGGSFPREELMGYIDIYDPQIGGKSKVYSLKEENAGLIAESQKRGEEFYWYVAAGPAYPYPNVQVEYPFVDSRVLFWMTWKYGVTGFEYYCYNIWNHNYSEDPADRYPNSPWKADGWEKGWPSNGDGMLFYPGPITSMRLESIRDGIEDWESLQVLRDCVEATKNRKPAEVPHALIARAETLLAVREEIVKGFQNFTRDPQRLLAERRELGEMISEFMKVVPKTQKWDPGAMTYAKAVEVRKARDHALRRAMLRERHIKACEALDVQPHSEEQWRELWPKRTLFAQDFEADGDWDGKVVSDHRTPGSKRAIEALGAEKYYAKRIRVGIYYDHARAATDTWVSFRYHLNEDKPLTVFVFNLSKGDNWRYTIENPTVGRWTETTLNVSRDFKPNRGGDETFEAGDALDDVFFFVGKPGEEDIELLVDDVKLIGRD